MPQDRTSSYLSSQIGRSIHLYLAPFTPRRLPPAYGRAIIDPKNTAITLSTGNYMQRFVYALFFTFVSFAPALAAEHCTASFYSYGPTASGAKFSRSAFTAAHKTHRFGTRLLVTNSRNKRSVVVRVTDRGPYIRGRCIDLTPAGAAAIAMNGIAPVTVEVID